MKRMNKKLFYTSTVVIGCLGLLGGLYACDNQVMEDESLQASSGKGDGDGLAKNFEDCEAKKGVCIHVFNDDELKRYYDHAYSDFGLCNKSEKCLVPPTPPVCTGIGTRSEAWVDGITGEFICYANCAKAKVTCDVYADGVLTWFASVGDKGVGCREPGGPVDEKRIMPEAQCNPDPYKCLDTTTCLRNVEQGLLPKTANRCIAPAGQEYKWLCISGQCEYTAVHKIAERKTVKCGSEAAFDDPYFCIDTDMCRQNAEAKLLPTYRCIGDWHCDTEKNRCEFGTEVFDTSTQTSEFKRCSN